MSKRKSSVLEKPAQTFRNDATDLGLPAYMQVFVKMLATYAPEEVNAVMDINSPDSGAKTIVFVVSKNTGLHGSFVIGKATIVAQRAIKEENIVEHSQGKHHILSFSAEEYQPEDYSVMSVLDDGAEADSLVRGLGGMSPNHNRLHSDSKYKRLLQIAFNRENKSTDTFTQGRCIPCSPGVWTFPVPDERPTITET
jgi:hypothetical protein